MTMVRENSDIASQLLQINAIKLSPQKPFTWASGMLSPIYCDNRIALSHPAVRTKIKKEFIEHSKSYQEIDLIAGVATAGIPWGAMLADALNVPFIYVRSKPKAHGRQNLIEGEFIGNPRILVIEDLISTGGSSIKAVNAIREGGGIVLGVEAIFQYEFKVATDAFESAKCPFSTLSNYSLLLEAAADLDYISSKETNMLKSWRDNPSAWSSLQGV